VASREETLLQTLMNPLMQTLLKIMPHGKALLSVLVPMPMPMPMPIPPALQ
jgi:hypothetical protein